MNRVGLAVVIYLGLLILNACNNPNRNDKNNASTVLENKTVELSINYDEQRAMRVIEDIVWREKMTVLDVLKHAQNEHIDFTFRVKQFEGMGDFVFSIDSLEGNNKNYWLFCVNGRPSNQGIASKVLAPGDVIVWHFTNESNPCEIKKR